MQGDLVVQQLIERLVRQLERQGVQRVKEVRVRKGTAFSAGLLLRAFQKLAEKTPLEGADLFIEGSSREHTCSGCGHVQMIASEDLTGPTFLACPRCGAFAQLDETHGLELVSVTVADRA